jgi:CRISPR-associated endonuclease Csn1
MNKILGIDLGTNSIGWAIRDPQLEENQIIDNGVLIFKKGVGEEKGVEFPMAAKRTEKRSIRRNYQVKKYQKWQLIRTLIESETPYCPLSITEFNRWYYYDKITKKRVYPMNKLFIDWLKLDFNNDSVAEYANPYILRAKAIQEKLSNFEVGRALYHLIQRRGFLSNRKIQGEENETIAKGSEGKPGTDSIANLIEQYGSLGAALANLDSKHTRIRNRYLLRTQVESELNLICEVQGIDKNSDFYKNIYKAIYWQRPLRSQKGLVGKCTLEKNKTRCPISHPQFEIFRAWSFINNIKYKYKSEDLNNFRFISDEWKEKIWNEKFLKIRSSSFDFEDIMKLLDGGKIKQYDFNYKPYQNIAASPICASLFELFGENWQTIRVGKYTIEDIWHVLFNFEDEYKVIEFALVSLGLDDKKVEKFKILWKKTPDGYAQLSLNAITKINEYLLQGFIYSEAVFYANMPKVLGADFFNAHKLKIQEGVKYIFDHQNETNDNIKIVNNLIGKFLALPAEEQFGWDETYNLAESDQTDIDNTIHDYFGGKKWKEFESNKQAEIRTTVSNLYLRFLKCGHGNKNKTFLKIPRLDEVVIQFLKDNFDHVTDKDLDKLYHPSDNDIYTPSLPSKVDYKKYLQSPKTGSFKNPMAMRTLHELKRLINYLIETEKIDEDDRIVIELARDLNDANMRKAIEKWQNENEKKNEEYKKEIERHGFNKNDKDLIQKVRLWHEQNHKSIYTGELINIADVFDGMKFQIEHTIPASLSFDDSLENKTLCETVFNAKKNNRIPTELENYNEIEARLEPWIKKVDNLKFRYEMAKKKSKSAQTKEAKDNAIQEKHLIRFELDYWKNKLYRFQMLEVKGGFRNANLIDTQIITKYAFHYMKSVFKRVDVQKGEVTAIFRKIFEINEDKDRSKHTHHTIDAAVLTLIPKAAERESVLKQYFESQEKNLKFHKRPWKGFHQSQLMKLEDETLVQNSVKEKAVLQTVKFVRKRGKIVYLKDADGKFILDDEGKKIPKVAKGDTIRGQLHDETMLGAIVLPKLDENKKPIRNETTHEFEYNENAKPIYVVRKALVFGDLGFTKKEQLENIVDPIVRQKVLAHVEKYGLNKETFKNPVWMNEEKGIRINKVRVKTSESEPLQVRQHVFLSKHLHKQHYYAGTAKGANIICAFYQYEQKGKIEREMEIINLMDAAALVSQKLLNEKGEIEIVKTIKTGLTIQPYALLKPGLKVIFYEKNLEELNELNKNTLSKRLYRILKFSEDRITFEFHLEARSASKISEKASELNDKNYFNGYSTINFNDPQPRYRLTKGNFNFAIEGKHFEIKPDGEIKWMI